MYTDAQLRFSNGQSLAGAAATTVSTNTVDLLSANNNNIGIGFPRRIEVQVAVPFAGGTSVRAEIIESANADLSSPTVIAVGPTVTTANATAGATLLDVVVPNTRRRYLGVQYVTVGTHSAGSVHAHLVLEADHQPYLPANLGR